MAHVIEYLNFDGRPDKVACGSVVLGNTLRLHSYDDFPEGINRFCYFCHTGHTFVMAMVMASGENLIDELAAAYVEIFNILTTGIILKPPQ